jgi:hypothetical protein
MARKEQESVFYTLLVSLGSARVTNFDETEIAGEYCFCLPCEAIEVVLADSCLATAILL